MSDVRASASRSNSLPWPANSPAIRSEAPYQYSCMDFEAAKSNDWTGSRSSQYKFTVKVTPSSN